MVGDNSSTEEEQTTGWIPFSIGTVISLMLVLYITWFMIEGNYLISTLSIITLPIVVKFTKSSNFEGWDKAREEFRKGRRKSLQETTTGQAKKGEGSKPIAFEESTGKPDRFEGEKKGLKERLGKYDLQEIDDKDLRGKVKDKQRAGWKIAEIDNGEGYVVMYRSKGGGVGRHGIVAFLTGAWTLGAGNYVYEKATKRRNREKIVLRADDAVSSEGRDKSRSQMDTEPKTEVADRLRELKELRDEGVVSDEEFRNKKEELLNEL